MSSRNKSLNKNINDFSSVKLVYHDLRKNLLLQKKNNSISNGKDNKLCNLTNSSQNANSPIINHNNKEKKINRAINSNFFMEDNKNIDNNNSIKFNKVLFYNNTPFNNMNLQKNTSIDKIISSDINSKTYYLKKQLFPYRYYLFSIFKRNMDASKKSFMFSRKFIVVYNFICQLFDISSYLILQREFQTMKNAVMQEKERNIIENGQKININENSFNINMKECLDAKRFSIFGSKKSNALNYRNSMI
jgi:hypothetical protein